MKFGKKTTAIIGLAAGVTLLASSAFADAIMGSGYTSLKEAAKTTMAKVSKELDSFTANAALTVKVDGETFAELSTEQKMDVVNRRVEGMSQGKDATGYQEGYQYHDDTKNIYKSGDDETYYVHEMSGMTATGEFISNPFEEEMAVDAEKIMDAFVGNLQDLVQVEEADGKRMYMGNLSETQVPPLANAVMSFCVKYGMMDDHTTQSLGIPQLVSDISVKNAAGKAIENEDGIIENVVGSGALVGKDENGVEHTFTAEFTITMTDINATTVNEPDLSGKKVEYNKATTSNGAIDGKYVGTYTSNVVEREGDAFVKVGQRVLTIESADGHTISGSFAESYADGKAPASGAQSFTFTGEPVEDGYGMVISYTNADGSSAQGILRPDGNNNVDLYLQLDIEFMPGGGYSSNGDMSAGFTRVFE